MIVEDILMGKKGKHIFRTRKKTVSFGRGCFRGGSLLCRVLCGREKTVIPVGANHLDGMGWHYNISYAEKCERRSWTHKLSTGRHGKFRREFPIDGKGPYETALFCGPGRHRTTGEKTTASVTV